MVEVKKSPKRDEKWLRYCHFCVVQSLFLFKKNQPPPKKMIFYFEIRISKQKYQARIILMVFLKPENQGFIDYAKILEFWVFLFEVFF